MEVGDKVILSGEGLESYEYQNPGNKPGVIDGIDSDSWYTVKWESGSLFSYHKDWLQLVKEQDYNRHIKYGNDTGVTKQEAIEKLERLGFTDHGCRILEDGVLAGYNGMYINWHLGGTPNGEEVFVDKPIKLEDIEVGDTVNFNEGVESIIGTGTVSKLDDRLIYVNITSREDGGVLHDNWAFYPHEITKVIKKKDTINHEVEAENTLGVEAIGEALGNYLSNGNEIKFPKISALPATRRLGLMDETHHIKPKENFNNKPKQTMNAFETTQSEAFFGNKKNIEAIKDISSKLDTQLDIIDSANSKLEKAAGQIRNIRWSLKQAIDSNNYEKLATMIPEIQSHLKYLAKFQERTIFDIAELPQAPKAVSSEEFFS